MRIGIPFGSGRAWSTAVTIDAGSLRIARYTESCALLTGQLAYEGKRGPRVAHRFERFAR